MYSAPPNTGATSTPTSPTSSTQVPNSPNVPTQDIASLFPTPPKAQPNTTVSPVAPPTKRSATMTTTPTIPTSPQVLQGPQNIPASPQFTPEQIAEFSGIVMTMELTVRTLWAQASKAWNHFTYLSSYEDFYIAFSFSPEH